MNWSDERYVRLYTRDTADWLALSFDAQALFALLLRKVDRAGVMDLGRNGKKAVAVQLSQVALWPRIEAALDELLVDGCILITGDRLVVRNFIEAQESTQSDRLRSAQSRERRRLHAVTKSGEVVTDSNDDTPRDTTVTNGDAADTRTHENVTGRHASVTESHSRTHGVTSGHTASRGATPCCAVPSVPYRAEPSDPERARARETRSIDLGESRTRSQSQSQSGRINGSGYAVAGSTSPPRPPTKAPEPEGELVPPEEVADLQARLLAALKPYKEQA